jgi:hypothetical protein
MIIVNEYPPNVEQIKQAFPAVEHNKGVVFTYGQIIYNPSGHEIDKPLQFHEATHSIQQDKMGPDKWWEKYIQDVTFRINQEAEAYLNQYNKFKKLERDRNKHAQFLYGLAQQLSSDIYGNILSHSDALKEIKNHGH